MTRPTHLVVEAASLSTRLLNVPVDAVTTHDGERIYVGATKAKRRLGWDVERDGDPRRDPASTPAGMGNASDADRRRDGRRRTDVDPARREAIPRAVHEEELTATTRQREIGEVRVETTVVAEERTIEVPVTEERVRVERRRSTARPGPPTRAPSRRG
jgi:hypothetical protein